MKKYLQTCVRKKTIYRTVFFIWSQYTFHLSSAAFDTVDHSLSWNFLSFMMPFSSLLVFLPSLWLFSQFFWHFWMLMFFRFPYSPSLIFPFCSLSLSDFSLPLKIYLFERAGKRPHLVGGGVAEGEGERVLIRLWAEHGARGLISCPWDLYLSRNQESGA